VLLASTTPSARVVAKVHIRTRARKCVIQCERCRIAIADCRFGPRDAGRVGARSQRYVKHSRSHLHCLSVSFTRSFVISGDGSRQSDVAGARSDARSRTLDAERRLQARLRDLFAISVLSFVTIVRSCVCVCVCSFGVILYEVLTRCSFFGELRFLHQLEERVLQGTRPELPSVIFALPNSLCASSDLMITDSWHRRSRRHSIRSSRNAGLK
jgi:hypothetical protein